MKVVATAEAAEFKHDAEAGERARDDDRRRARVRHPAEHDGQAALRPGRQDHRAQGDLVLRAPVHRLQELPDLAQAQQKGKLHKILENISKFVFVD